MKRLKLLCAFLFTIFLCQPISADEVKVVVNDISYSLDSLTMSASVCDVPDSGNVVIPSSIEYSGDVYPVTSIESHAFLSYKGGSVTIPNSVTKIKWLAFNAAGMDSLVIENGKDSLDFGRQRHSFINLTKYAYIGRNIILPKFQTTAMTNRKRKL